MFDDDDIQIVINNKNNKILIISFQGFDSNILDEHYKINKTNNLDKLKKINFYLKNTFDKITDYNYIYIRDKLQTWYSYNQDIILDKLKEEIKKLGNIITICIGQSAGGFASILFGSLLNANYIISIVPQTCRYQFFMNCELRKILCNNDNCKNNIYNDLKNINIKSKTFILTSNCIEDTESLKNIDLNNKKIKIKKYNINNHNIISYLGKDNFIKIILDLINKINKYELSKNYKII
jgi:hypothetical protein